MGRREQAEALYTYLTEHVRYDFRYYGEPGEMPYDSTTAYGALHDGLAICGGYAQGFQLLLEQAVGMFDGLAKSNSPWRNGFLGAYIFAAGAYIFFGTLFELFGFQAITTGGHTIALPAPLSDVNAAISLGCLSYGVILVGGIVANGAKGAGKALKDFSLPISMSFRMFGALLSGLLVTELVYYYVTLSYVIPVVVAVLFTLLHALIQAYVLTTLTSMFYGETTEKHAPKPKKNKKIKAETVNN